MKIFKARVLNFDSEHERPQLQLLVDTIPTEGFIFTRVGDTYHAESGGLIRAYHYAGPGTGMDRAEFAIELEDGELKTLRGPHAIGAGRINRLFRFHPCVDVTLTDDEEVFMLGRGYEAIVTLDKALEGLQFISSMNPDNPLNFCLLAQMSAESGLLEYIPILRHDARGKPEVLYELNAVGLASGLGSKLHQHSISFFDFTEEVELFKHQLRSAGLPALYSLEKIGQLSAQIGNLLNDLRELRLADRKKPDLPATQFMHDPEASKLVVEKPAPSVEVIVPEEEEDLP